LYPAWGGLTTALLNGVGAQQSGSEDTDFYRRIYADEGSREIFLGGMTGGARPVARAIAERFPWAEHRDVCDIGCAEGGLLVEVARQHAHLRGVGFDLHAVESAFDRLVRLNELQDRLTFRPGNFRTDAFPSADVIVLGRVLHNWNLETRQMLLEKAHQALPAGGCVLVYERLIDDDRRSNATALLASLNMLIVTPEGGDFTGAQCADWMRRAGFSAVRVEHLIASHAMVIGTK
jgi:cyclopropane fatty-acyl-phospholipid synthase-like methyltransferase